VYTIRANRNSTVYT